MNNETSIIYHLGAPHTDNDQITWSLRRDTELLADIGTMIRKPKEYRKLIKDMILELEGDEPSIVDQEGLLSSIIRNQQVDRLIMSDSRFLGVPAWMFYGGEFYKNAGRNTARIRNLFPNNPCEFYLGISSPANFIPAVFNTQTDKSYEQFIDGAVLETLRWSDVISQIQQQNPDCPITVWCNEDTPIIWPSVLREIAGLDPQVRLQGELDVIGQIMSPDGVELLVKYLEERPNLSEIQRRRIRGIFLEKFYLDDAVEEEIDLPGWTDETVDALTDIYEDDIERIERLPGVNFISP
ncbi:hypothetical protein [Profundibacter sp.]